MKFWYYKFSICKENVISDQHEKSLNKILRGNQCDGEKKVNSETDITIALAEHLLGKLSPGKSYTIDSRVKKKGKCRCGFSHCKSDPGFGSTGIGMLHLISVSQRKKIDIDKRL